MAGSCWVQLGCEQPGSGSVGLFAHRHQYLRACEYRRHPSAPSTRGSALGRHHLARLASDPCSSLGSRSAGLGSEMIAAAMSKAERACVRACVCACVCVCMREYCVCVSVCSPERARSVCAGGPPRFPALPMPAACSPRCDASRIPKARSHPPVRSHSRTHAHTWTRTHPRCRTLGSALRILALPGRS